MLSKPKSGSGTGGAFLKPSMLKGGRGVLTIAGEPQEQTGQFGTQILIPVRFNGTAATWAFNVNSGNHVRLDKRFGNNPKKWKGTVKVEVKSFNNNDYIAVSD